MTRPTSADDEARLRRAVEVGATARAVSPPNPWVGCVLVTADGTVIEGATEAVGGRHAEIVALDAAGDAAEGATVYVTLEPCSHHGRTPPCSDALIAAGVARVVVGVCDPDDHVAGTGVEALRAAGIVVDVVDGPLAATVEDALAAYLHQRRTGRPSVVLKLAATLDGLTAAADGTSRWITGAEARRDVHRLRSESDAIVVGAGTVRADDPELTVRHVPAPRGDPERIVLGTIPPGAKVLPARSHVGPFAELLDDLGARGDLQVLVEGGAGVAADLHASGLVDRYVVYLAPALGGGRSGSPLLAGSGLETIADLWRGRFVAVRHLGDDLCVEMVPG